MRATLAKSPADIEAMFDGVVEHYDITTSAEAWIETMQQALACDCRRPTGLVELLLGLLDEAGPRMLLGKKYTLGAALLKLGAAARDERRQTKSRQKRPRPFRLAG